MRKPWFSVHECVEGLYTLKLVLGYLLSYSKCKACEESAEAGGRVQCAILAILYLLPPSPPLTPSSRVMPLFPRTPLWGKLARLRIGLVAMVARHFSRVGFDCRATRACNKGRIYIRPTNKGVSPIDFTHGRSAFVGGLDVDTPLLQAHVSCRGLAGHSL